MTDPVVTVSGVRGEDGPTCPATGFRCECEPDEAMGVGLCADRPAGRGVDGGGDVDGRQAKIDAAKTATLEAWLLEQLHTYDCWGGETDADPDRHSMCKEIVAPFLAAMKVTGTWYGDEPEVQFSTPYLTVALAAVGVPADQERNERGE